MLLRRLLLHTSRHVRPTMASSRSSSNSSGSSGSSGSTGTFGPLTGPKGTWPNDAKTGPKGKPMTPVPSASLIVLCPVSSRGRQEYATLTVQRSARDGSSFRSAIVFPGGVLDLADEDAIKRQAAGSLSPCTNTGAKDEEDAVYWQSLRLCALRETFEETGLVLLAADGPSQGLPRSRAVGPTEAGIDRQEWARIREEVHNDARAFTPFLARIASSLSGSDVESLLPPLAPMYHHSNWVTPRSIIRPAKRFDAHFFLTVLDKADVLGPLTSSPQGADSSKTSNLLNLSADGTETLSLRLATPQELVDLGCSDKVVMFPPQFYILSDLAASLRSPDPLASVRPLIFRRPEQSSPASSSSSPATTVEEEPRGLGGKNYNWDRMPSNPPALSWVSDKLPPLSSSSSDRQDEGRLSVTSVMPRALPGSGTNVNLSSFSWRKDDATNTTEASGREQKKDNEDEEAEEEGEESFVFPLVLPGDFLASELQKRALWPPQAPSSSTTPSQVEAKGDLPLNRVYVSPRSKKDGGGLVIIGSVRRGQAGLMDFEEGRKLDVIGNIEELEEEDDEEDDEEEGSPRSKL